jgi:hypothetical protein
MNLKENEKSEKEFLEDYNIEKYERPSITNDVIIFTTDDIKEDNLLHSKSHHGASNQ